MIRCALRLALSALLPLAACTRQPGEAREPQAPGRAAPVPARDAPNVLVVTLDTFRADHMPGFGGDAGRWPELARWSNEGRRFTRAYTVAPVTIPAHTSLFTAKEPRRHRVRAQRPDLTPLGYDVLTVFGAAGWHRAGFIASSVLGPTYGPLYTGFDHYGAADAMARPGGEVLREAQAWLSGAPNDRPVFVWLHLFDTHMPYAPKVPRFAKCPEAARATAFAAMRTWSPMSPVNLQPYWWGPCLEDLYAGEVDEIDQLMGAVRGLLADRPRWIWAVLADHGECVDDEGVRARHAATLLECAVRIPLVIGAEGVAPGDDERLASIIDVGPTLARLAGLPLSGVEGLDLLAPAPPGRVLRFETPGVNLAGQDLPRVGVWGEAHKLVASGRPWRREAWARTARGLAPVALEVVDATLRAELDALIQDPPPLGQDASGVEPGVSEQLRALGYAR